MDILRGTAGDENIFENITFERNSKVLVPFETCHSEKDKKTLHYNQACDGPEFDHFLEQISKNLTFYVQRFGVTVRGDRPRCARFLQMLKTCATCYFNMFPETLKHNVATNINNIL